MLGGGKGPSGAAAIESDLPAGALGPACLSFLSKPQIKITCNSTLQAKTFHSHTHRGIILLGLKMNPSVFSWQEMGTGNSSYSSLTVT